MTICLIMFVKDEAEFIERCLRSVRELVYAWRIVDTGSTDATVALIEQELEGIPGQLYHEPFVSHAENRNRLLQLAKESGCDYALMMDGDTEMVVLEEWPELVLDEYLIPVHQGRLVYDLPFVTSTKKPFRYKGVRHNYLTCDMPASTGRLPAKILDLGGGARRPGKIEEDMRLLQEEVAKNPLDTRSWFYLAQTYRDLGMVQESITAYKMRVELGGWEEEVYWSLYQLGVLVGEHVNGWDAMELLIRASRLKPDRAEAMRAIARLSTSIADKVPRPDGGLFLLSDAYKSEEAA